MADSFLIALPRDKRERFLTAIMKGLPFRTACKLVRISPVVLRNFFNTAEQILAQPYYVPEDYSDSENELVQFYLAVQENSAHYEEALINNIANATDKNGNPDWRASQFLLQSKNPEDFAKQTQNPNIQINTNLTNANANANSNSNSKHIDFNNLDLNRLSIKEVEALEYLLRKASSPVHVIEADPNPNDTKLLT